MTVHDDDPFKLLEADFRAPKYPGVDTLVSRIQEVNERRSKGELELDDETMQALVKEFDKEWPLRSSGMQITGKIYSVPRKEATEAGTNTAFMQERRVNGAEVLSIGFDPRILDGEEVIGHVFIFDTDEEDDVIFPSSDSQEYLGWAPVDDEIEVDGMTVPWEGAKEYLAYYLPATLQWIDERKKTTSNPMEFIEKLKQFEVDGAELMGSSKKKDTDAIGNYLSNVCGLEAFVPYSAAFRGIHFYKTGEVGKLRFDTEEDWQHVLMSPEKIIMAPVMEPHENGKAYVPNNNRFIPVISAQVHFLDRNDIEEYIREYLIPITDDLHMISNTPFLRRVDTDKLD